MEVNSSGAFLIGLVIGFILCAVVFAIWDLCRK
jgi:hypothetical protein